MFSVHHPLVFTFGLLGNIISFMVYLAPLPTFRRIYRKKSTEGFQSVPYVVAIFSSMLWIYYALLKSNSYLLITINSVGCIIETIYIAVYIAYAPRKARILTFKLMVFLNFGGFFLILLLTHYCAKGSGRIKVVGWVCVALSIFVFGAPLSIIRLVIRTKSVEFMPFYLSFFLTLSAIMWFFYGILQRDFYIALPNVLGFIFGAIQIVLFVMYKNHKKIMEEPEPPAQLPEHIVAIVKLNTIKSSEVQPVSLQPNCDDTEVGENQNGHDQTEQNEKSMNPSIEVQLSECDV